MSQKHHGHPQKLKFNEKTIKNRIN